MNIKVKKIIKSKLFN